MLIGSFHLEKHMNAFPCEFNHFIPYLQIIILNLHQNILSTIFLQKDDPATHEEIRKKCQRLFKRLLKMKLTYRANLLNSFLTEMLYF